jgi:phospholipid-binding lipoprotein MlaA
MVFNNRSPLKLLKSGALCFILAMSMANTVQAATDADPLEGWNRRVHAFNMWGDKFLVKPIAKGYDFIVPEFLDTGVSNVFSNLREPMTIVNDVLQLKFKQAGLSSSRLLINSSVGLLGFFDVATEMGIEANPEDFGQTLGHWGVGAGPYIVLPFMGPSTLRDVAGIGADIYTNPVTYIDPASDRAIITATSLVDRRADALGVEELLTGDTYIFLRDSYLQSREYAIADGDIEDDFGDEDF